MSASSVLSQEEQMVVFQLDTELFSIDIFRVNEIIRLREITPIPGTDAHIRGLVNLRGKTIPVVDLRVRFGMPEFEEKNSTRIIVVEMESGNVGIIVDAVREVFTVQPEQVENTPALISTVDMEFVRGVAKHSDHLVTLLNLDQALAA
ncbi:MAG: purine-binding chemotaxis protein CheW [Fimbriimonadaceae bacterium]|nr:purine-binding chemotaxis protein CheW [Fimbriimonadaceae bacterium]